MKNFSLLLVGILINASVIIFISDYTYSQTQIFKFTFKGKTVNPDSAINNYITPDKDTTVPVLVQNMTDTAMKVKVKKIIIDTLAGTSNTFCWGTCFSPEVYTSPNSRTIYSKGTDNSFYADYVPSGKSGTTKMLYVFFDLYNSKDSSYFYINFISKPNAVFEIHNSNLLIQNFNLYPNPVSQLTKITFNLTQNADISLRIYDMFGNQVSSLPGQYLSKGNHIFDYNSKNLSSGTYYCALLSQDQTLTVKKITVIK